MKNYLNHIKVFFFRILIILFFYQIARLLFFFFNYNLFSNVTLKTFWGGIVYDLSVLGYINMLFAILYLIPLKVIKKHNYQRNVTILFYVINIIFFATNFIDFEYYKFTGRRSTFDLITASGMKNEIGGLLISYSINYWYIPLSLIICAYFIIKLIKKIKLSDLEFLHNKKNWAAFILSFGILFLFARGGVQSKPLRIVDAINYTHLGNSPICLNTPFCILKSIGKKETLKHKNYFSENEAEKYFNPNKDYQSKIEANKKKNVVIIILESFGMENVQKGYTPFLDSLITKSYFFKNGFANGKVSIDAVPSIMSSIPSLMDRSLIASEYSLNKVYGLPKIFRKNGYNTSFFHGAFNGSQNFDQYCKVAGFEKYYGKDQYPEPHDNAFDGRWGIYDEEFLQYFNGEIKSFKEPFFTTVFTISSHPPFNLPERYKGKFKKGTSEYHETIGYSDMALRKFFEKAKKEKWFKNTLFVLTADHTSAYGKGFSSSIDKFRIPILFYDVSNPNLKGVNELNFQQTDILPSIVDYLGFEEKIVAFGKSFLSNKNENFTVNYLDNVYNIIKDDYYLAFDGTKTLELYNFKKDPNHKNNLIKKEPMKLKELENFAKAYIQSFNSRLIDNKMVR